LLVNRVEQHQINKNHQYWKVIDEYCKRSKDLYNSANYVIRQEFINNKNYINYYTLDKIMQNTDQYKILMSQASQCTLQVLSRSWKSFFRVTRDYSKNSNKYLGKPKIPKYKKKEGRFTWFLKNNQTYIKDGYLYFRLKVFEGYGFKTNIEDRLISVRFVPNGSNYTMEIVYEKEIEKDLKEPKNICSIDLGVNNFVTMVNNINERPIIINGKGIKSVNQYYNKRKAKIQSELNRHSRYWSNKLDNLNLKRYNRIKNFIHNTSRYIINYCNNNDIDTLVIGLNKAWKQDCVMNDKATQNFVFVPYDMLLKQLGYKCEENNINLIITEESYTSGTSYLDNEQPTKANYQKKRRIKRGLFKSDKGILINSDVNGAFQIMKKVFSEIEYEIEGCLSPIILNVVNIA